MTARPRQPGLFITATDTGVGKTVITCAIARLLGQSGVTVGVCKPVATGCRRDDDRLVSDDGRALAASVEHRWPESVITPVRYGPPLAPAAAAALTGRPVDFHLIDQALGQLDAQCDVILVEGIGGWLVPLDARRTVGDLAAALGWPVVVVTRPTLGTLNHTALTCAAIRSAGLEIAGLVINGCGADSSDPSVATNAAWLARLCRVEVLAQVPWCDGLDPLAGRLSDALLQALGQVDWSAVAQPPSRLSPQR